MEKHIAFGWYGGKYSHLDWILPLLPKAQHYCEPFGGSAAKWILEEIDLRHADMVVMATHDLDIVRQAPYRVIELQEGALVYDSAVDEPRDQVAAP